MPEPEKRIVARNVKIQSLVVQYEGDEEGAKQVLQQLGAMLSGSPETTGPDDETTGPESGTKEGQEETTG